tara:strand:+ start:1729 stop:1935 length:207 start_codon:yes stop_codon:yes gene_type:complete
MTQNEREEFIFDLAVHRVKKLSQAGVFAMAVDQMCSILSRESDEHLLEVAPYNLHTSDKKKHNKATGF